MLDVRLAIVGATGLVGKTMLDVLQARGFPAENLKLLASGRSQGAKISYGDQLLEVEKTTPLSFEDVSIALFASTEDGAKIFAPEAIRRGCVVIDNGSTFRLCNHVPLVVPEVNPQALEKHHGIIANPNCSTIQMVMVLKPLDDAFGVKEVFVSSYQSVSGWGKKALELYEAQAKAYVEKKPLPEDKSIFAKPIFGNVIPHIDRFLEDGRSREEDKMIQETAKILGKKILVHPLCVRVPVRIGHAEALFVVLGEDVEAEDVRKALESFPNVVVQDDLEASCYPTPCAVEGKDEVFVGRIRKLKPYAFSMFVVADNLRKGAATNAIQIAEMLVQRRLLQTEPEAFLTSSS